MILLCMGFQLNASVWKGVVDGFRLHHYPQTSEIEAAKQHMLANGINKTLELSRPWLVYVLSQVQARGLPSELALIPFVESNYQPLAVSHTNAKGMWQFVENTAPRFDLQISKQCDERFDVIQSTAAALDYLSLLREDFGDWYLAIAAYNAGPTTVENVQRFNLANGVATDFWHLTSLRQETKEYVPKILALKQIIEQKVLQNEQLPIIPRVNLFKSVVAHNQSLQDIQRQYQTSADVVSSLNPCWEHDALINGQILLPINRTAEFVLAGWL